MVPRFNFLLQIVLFPDIRALCSWTAESKAMKATTAELLPKTSDAATDQDILL